MSVDARPSRRAVVGAALALAAAGVTGAARAARGSAPDGAVVSEGRLAGRHGLESPRWRLAVPAAGPARGLVVSLHGFGGDADSTFDLGYADAVAATGLALASVDGGNGYWHARADGTDSGAVVLEQLVPLALARSGLPPASRIGLLGWSMGGFGALLLASELGRAHVTGVVAVSAALWLRAGQTPARAFDGRADFEQHTVFGRLDRLRGIPVRLDCGASDPFVAANRELARRRPGTELHVEPGGHEDAWWAAHASAEMAWLAARA